MGAVLSALLIIQTGFGLTHVNAEKSNEVQTQVKKPSIIGTSGAVIDANTGEFLYTKNENKKEYPASITKIMTAILVEEHLNKSDMITISQNAASQEASNPQIIYRAGEKVSVDDAMESLMIVSANDAAFALAEAVGGSVEEFSKMMNEKAKELGVTHTHFVTPNGLPNADHYTTAHDMALIGREALKYPDIIEKMGLREARIQTDQRDITIVSKNKISTKTPKAIGGKTGFTDEAQHTLLEVLQDGDKKVIAVTMHSTKEGQYKDMNAMSEYAFSKMKTKKLFQKGEIYRTYKMNGKEFPLTLKENAVVSFVEKGKKTLTQVVKWNTEKKEYLAGETVAWLVVKNNGQEIRKFALKTNKAMKPGGVEKNQENAGDRKNVDSPSKSIISYFWMFTLVILAAFVTFILWAERFHHKRRKKLYRQ